MGGILFQLTYEPAMKRLLRAQVFFGNGRNYEADEIIYKFPNYNSQLSFSFFRSFQFELNLV